MNKNKKGMTLVGGSSLLVIFATLCFTVFALLTLSTVKADLRLADASVQSVEDYYRADCEAEEILAALRAGKIPEDVVREGNTYSYACKISETGELQVVVEAEGDNYRILKWKAVSVADWIPEEYIEVWTPEE